MLHELVTTARFALLFAYIEPVALEHELHFGVREQAELFPEMLRYGYLSLLRDTHM